VGDKSKIEWTDATWNPTRARNRIAQVGEPGWKTGLPGGKTGWHCEHVSEGCRNCYAESMNRRLGTGLAFKPGHRADIEILLDEQMLLAPLRWKKPRRIFVNSMTDTFAEFVRDEWLDRMFAVMALAPQHTFQVLTKRPERMWDYIGMRAGDWILTLSAAINTVEMQVAADRPGREPPRWPLRNVWLGISAEDQAAADERIPLLLQTPAAVRFVSLEPLLGPIKLADAVMPWAFEELRQRIVEDKKPHPRDGKLDWVIVGGESGPHARPMHPQWCRDVRDQCAAAGVPFFFKQWGEWRPHAQDFPRNADRAGIVYPNGTFRRRGLGDATGDGGADMFMAGKKASGRLLDGVQHNGMPS
jgi:protein gp37